jgi:hypothetical protein
MKSFINCPDRGTEKELNKMDQIIAEVSEETVRNALMYQLGKINDECCNLYRDRYAQGYADGETETYDDAHKEGFDEGYKNGVIAGRDQWC